MPALVALLMSLMVVAAGVAFALRRSAPEEFRGSQLQPPRDTLGFTLTDQNGQTVSLQGLRGRVVVLTFLYTSCPDICPFTTARLHQVHQMLGKEASQVVFLAVTMDPERDTVERVRQYSEQWNMADKWHFLTGSREELAPLWDYYWAGDGARRAMEGSERDQALEHGHDSFGLDTSALQGWVGDYMVEHLAPIHLIDRQGKVRVAMSSAFQVEDLAHDVRLLLD